MGQDNRVVGMAKQVSHFLSDFRGILASFYNDRGGIVIN